MDTGHLTVSIPRIHTIAAKGRTFSRTSSAFSCRHKGRLPYLHHFFSS